MLYIKIILKSVPVKLKYSKLDKKELNWQEEVWDNINIVHIYELSKFIPRNIVLPARLYFFQNAWSYKENFLFKHS